MQCNYNATWRSDCYLVSSFFLPSHVPLNYKLALKHTQFHTELQIQHRKRITIDNRSLFIEFRIVIKIQKMINYRLQIITRVKITKNTQWNIPLWNILGLLALSSVIRRLELFFWIKKALYILLYISVFSLLFY